MGLFKFLKNKFDGDKTNQTKKYVQGLSSSRQNFASKLDELSKKYTKVNESYFEQLEEILIEADIGVSFTLNVIDEVLNESINNKISDPLIINEILVDKMFLRYATKGDIENDITFIKDDVTVLLICGVNGVGKTTSIAKIANRYIKRNKKVMFAACDTFRAGAVEQLTIWANRLNCPIIKGEEGEDPASVAYKACSKAKEENIDLLIIDTAGRLQNKVNLMKELEKISNVIKKVIPSGPHDTFLIIDATTGQNGVLQAKQFLDCIKISGIVITKMDGSSKGGIILSIRDELSIPVRFIGLGEGIDDLEEFDLDKYLYGLCVGESK